MEIKRTNYILIDHENIRSLEFPEIGELPVKVLLFVSEQSKKPEWEEVSIMLKRKMQLELITMEGSGKNSLDFLIAFHAGRISIEEPDAYIHIISKDKGFDPLITHIKNRKFHARRSEAVCDLPIFQKEEATRCAPKKPFEQAITHLTKIAKNRPRKRKTLTSYLVAHFGNQITSDGITALIAALEKAGKLAIDEKDAVNYKLT